MEFPIEERIIRSPKGGLGTRVSRPEPSTRPLVEALRFNHFKNDGKFDYVVKRNIIQDLFRCISGYEDLWTNPDDPETGKASFKAYDFHRVELEDEHCPYPRPYSVRGLQIKQNREHLARNGLEAEPLERRRKGRKCGQIIERLAPVYTCKTCFRDSAPLICVECFRHSDHEGHDVAFKTNYNFAPVCDCGALNLYKDPKLHSCIEHPIADPDDPPRDTFDPAYTDSPDVPQEFKRALYETFVICIEYIIETFQCAPPPDNYGRLPKDLKELKRKWGLSYTSIHDAWKRAEGPWSVAIFADERHNEPELVRQMAHATGADDEACTEWVRELDLIGRKIIDTSSSPTVAFFLANMFQQIDVPVSLRHAYDTYQESVASTIIEWLVDICECHVSGDPDLTTQIMAQVLREDKYPHPSGRIAPDLRRMLRDTDNARPRTWSRLDWMWLIDSRLWRQPKERTRGLYAKMMTVHPLNTRFMAHRFAEHYVVLAQDYLHAERDQETSLYQFLAYTITSDGKAMQQACEKSGLLSTMVEVLEAWYRHLPGDYRDAIPLAPDSSRDSAVREIHLRHLGHKNKKGIYLLTHLRTLLELDDVANWVGTTQVFVHRVNQFADLFIGMQPQTHETEHHVQYEVDWYKPFNMMSELAKLMRQLGECYQNSSLGEICELIRSSVARIINDINLWSDVLDQAKTDSPLWREVKITYTDGTAYPVGGTTLKLIVTALHGVEGFSFHHYNHYFLGQMIESLARVFGQHLPKIDFPNMLTMVLATDEDEYDDFTRYNGGELRYNVEKAFVNTLLMIEQPLAKYIILNHIRAGRWRRNGNSVRHQHNAYVDVSRRDVTVDQEFYLLQAALLMLGPADFVLVTMDRWGLEDATPVTARYMMNFLDPAGTLTDMEDFLWFLIHISIDTDRAMLRSIEDLTTREIVQYLAIKPMVFAELSKRLSDRMTERVEVSKLVQRVADFRGPTETAPGTYTLKPEFIPEVDPLWRHYSRNDRKDVFERLLKKTFEARSDRSIEFEDWFYIPRKPELPPDPKPFCHLNSILRSPIAVHVLQIVIEYCVLMEDDEQFHDVGIIKAEIPRFESLLDMALHFATLAIRAEPDAFIPNTLRFNGIPVGQMACPWAFSRQVSLYQNLWYIEASNLPVYKPYSSRIRYLTRHIRRTFSEEDRTSHEEVTAKRRNPAGAAAPVVADKGAAAARQKQVMAEFARKQAAFAANMSFGDDGEEDDADMDEDEGDSNDPQGPCIVCQDPVTPLTAGGMLALFQPSRIIRETLMDYPNFAEQSLHIPSDFDNATRKLQYARNLSDRSTDSQILDSHPARNMRLGCYVSVCGHYMHELCMMQYFEHTKSRHNHHLHRNHPENISRQELSCPLCRSVSNFLLPIDFTATPVGTKKSFRANPKDGRPLTLLEHVRSMSAEGLKHINDSTKIWQHHTEGGHVKAWFSDNIPSRTLQNREKREIDMRGTSRMIDQFRDLLFALDEQSVALRKKKKPFYIPEDVVGYSISVLEIAQRGIARAPGQATVAEQLTDFSRKGVKKMFEEMKIELDGVYGKSDAQAGLRVAIFARFLPDWYRASSLPTPLLLRDPLSIVIECAAIAPDVLHPVIVMAYYAELCRALISVSVILRKNQQSWQNWPIAADPFQYDAGPFAQQAKARFANFTETAIGMFRNATPYNDVENVLRTIPDALLSKMLYMYTLPFVRRAAIIFYSVHGCYPVSRPEDIITEGCEYDRLGSLLALPDPRVTLADKASGIEGTMVLRWLSQWASGGRHMGPPEVPEIYELKFLPKHLDELILRYGDEVCNKCARAPAFPGLCLFCGDLVCIGGDCCAMDELGECNTHMQVCGAATGIFIDVKRCCLIILFAGGGSFLNAPYLDEHGDPDGGGQKGHRLILNEQRYEEIRRNAWLGHSIPHLIGRKMEATIDAGGWNAL